MKTLVNKYAFTGDRMIHIRQTDNLLTLQITSQNLAKTFTSKNNYQYVLDDNFEYSFTLNKDGIYLYQETLEAKE